MGADTCTEVDCQRLKKRCEKLHNEVSRLRRVVAALSDRPGCFWTSIGNDAPVVCCAQSLRYAKASAARKAEDKCVAYAAVYRQMSDGGLLLVAERVQRGGRRWQTVNPGKRYNPAVVAEAKPEDA